MTTLAKKKIERFYAEEAAKLMGKNWIFESDREHPDFLINEDGQKFGLEVSELFTGELSRSGSKVKQAEAHIQKTITKLREKFEAELNIPLIVQFVGNLSKENMDLVLPALRAEHFEIRPIGPRKAIELGKGLRIYVRKTWEHAAEWYNVGDRVGWVNQNPIKQITDAIEKKSKEFSRYSQEVGPDVRLLLIANRRYNSGKISLTNFPDLDIGQFTAVYFFSYPESVFISESDS
ncbi:hypothetical protein [Micavibrio aeruginosavorus]|uniref:hypothetical protein n=1 Tax=Micavibrio aeruginosavorus TaxID=349221 RepID=UPI003F4AABDE